MALVVMRSEVEEDCRRLVDHKVVAALVNNDWDTAVGVQLNKPWFLKKY